jgi:hypothetical protein
MNDPIPVFFDSVNRSAIGVKPLQPFLEWLNAHDSEHPVDVIKNHNVYLIRSKDSSDEILAWLKKNFSMIFENELNEWYTDPAIWPQKRTYELFTKWFQVAYYSMVTDIEDRPLLKT